MCDMSEPRPIFKIFNADVVVYCLTRIFSVLLAVGGCKVFHKLLSNVFLALYVLKVDSLIVKK